MSCPEQNYTLVPPPAELADAESYGGSRRLFRDAALEFGVSLTENEYEDWCGLLVGACLVDHLLDVEKVEILPQITSILEGESRDDLNPRLQAETREYWAQLSQEKAQIILDNIGIVGELAAAQRETSSANTLVSIRLQEANILATLLALDVDGGSDIAARQQFNDWLRAWSRTGYLVDSLFDLRKDYTNGESGVKPTLSAARTVALAASKEAGRTLRKTPPRLLGRCAMNGTRYVLFNIKLSATQTDPA